MDLLTSTAQLNTPGLKAGHTTLAGAALKRKGLLENTVIFFQSYNGATQESRADHAGRPYRGGSNAPFRGWKQGLFEGGVRMSALMRWPGKIGAGQVVDGIGMAMDILPTFLALAGLDTPMGLDGRDQRKLVMRGGKSAHESFHWLYLGSRAGRKGDCKLIENPPKFPDDPYGEPTEKLWLSNLAKDPSEKKNWASEAPQVVEELLKLLPKKS